LDSSLRFAERFGPAVGGQLVGEADVTNVGEPPSEATEDFTPGLEDQPSAVGSDRQLRPFVETELTTELDRYHESPLRAEAN
jgi:hypothetical protein